MTDKKIEIVTQTVTAPPRKLNVKWTFELAEEEEIRKKPETQEEEADEIIHRLRTVPRRRNNIQHDTSLEGEIMEILSKSIAEEIDKELLECLKKK